MESGGAPTLPAAVAIIGATSHGSAVVSRVAQADATAIAATVTVDTTGASSPADATAVVCIDVPNVSGPATLITQHGQAERNSAAITPDAHRQVGFWGERLIGSHEGSRRVFGPVGIPHQNLAPHSPTTWASAIGGATVTPVTGPDGTANAGRFTVASGIDERQIYRATRAFAVGDTVLAGVWARMPNNDTFPDMGGGPLTIAQVATFPTDVTFDGPAFIFAPLAGAGEWEWCWTTRRVTAVVGAPPDLIFSLRAKGGVTIDFARPLLLHLPSTIPMNEAMALARHSVSWPDGAPVGSVSALTGQKLLAPAGIGVGNSAAATTPGTVVKKMEVFSATGASLGFVPIYDAIT